MTPDETKLAAFVDAMRRRREHVGLSVVETADRMGMSAKDVEDFETYVLDPDMTFLRRYALAVGAQLEFTVTPAARPGARAMAASLSAMEREIATVALMHTYQNAHAPAPTGARLEAAFEFFEKLAPGGELDVNGDPYETAIAIGLQRLLHPDATALAAVTEEVREAAQHLLIALAEVDR